MHEMYLNNDNILLQLKQLIALQKEPFRGIGVFVNNDKVELLYEDSGKNSVLKANSFDGFGFEKELQEYINNAIHDPVHCVRMSVSQSGYIVTGNLHGDTVLIESVDGCNWDKLISNHFLSSPGYLIDNFRINNRFLFIGGSDGIDISVSSQVVGPWVRLRKIFPVEEKGDYTIECAWVSPVGIHVVYTHKNSQGIHNVGIFVLDLNDPLHIVWSTQEPLWDEPEDWFYKSEPIGAIQWENKIIGYWNVQGQGVVAVVYMLLEKDFRYRSRALTVQLQRSEVNPIISPNAENQWEAFNTFNPAAVYLNGKVHIIYRAQGHNYVSVLGYATSTDGLHIDERLDDPIYLPQEQFEHRGTAKPLHTTPTSNLYVSAGGYGGSEDPRITVIDDRVYMTYVAYDGATPPRVALTSISVEDFLNRRWLWEKPVLITPPGEVNKNAVIFPEKINGKYVIMHRVYPNILIDYVDSLNFDGETKWLKGQYSIAPRIDKWDSKKIGAGAPPIKTPAGWLLIYQSVGYQDPGKYKIGAMLLDLDDPTKVLHRSNEPILEPQESYENEGFKAGVVYPCGAVVIDDTLFVYYGGADSHVCVAVANLDTFLKELMYFEVAKLEPAVIRKVL